MKTDAGQSGTLATPEVSPLLLRLFSAYSGRYLLKHFHAVRLLRTRMPFIDSPRPVVIYLNHASWWDPLVCLLLAREFFPRRTSFAPIDARMLERYGIFKKLGFFAVEPGSARGALTFLRAARAILATSQHALWLTPQGRFVDVRDRPIQFARGIGGLAVRQKNAAFVPVAIDYCYWAEPRPEILVAFGSPTIPGESAIGRAQDWSDILASEMEALQDELTKGACRRNSADWLTIERGRSGGNAIYDGWQRLRLTLCGGQFNADHQPELQP